MTELTKLNLYDLIKGEVHSAAPRTVFLEIGLKDIPQTMAEAWNSMPSSVAVCSVNCEAGVDALRAIQNTYLPGNVQFALRRSGRNDVDERVEAYARNLSSYSGLIF